MANNLSTKQREAFQNSYFQEGDFVFTTTLVNGSKSIDISDYLIDVRPIDDRLFNYNDRVPGSLIYPSMVIRVFNETGLFSVGHSTSTWIDDNSTDKVDGWLLRTRLQETVSTGSAIDLMPETDWYVVDVEYQQGTATITAIHPLMYHYHKIWSAEEDSHSITWTSATSHYGPDWDYSESS